MLALKAVEIFPSRNNTSTMSTSEEIHRLESELETHKDELHQDAALINDKIEETKAQLKLIS